MILEETIKMAREHLKRLEVRGPGQRQVVQEKTFLGFTFAYRYLESELRKFDTFRRIAAFAAVTGFLLLVLLLVLALALDQWTVAAVGGAASVLNLAVGNLIYSRIRESRNAILKVLEQYGGMRDLLFAFELADVMESKQCGEQIVRYILKHLPGSDVAEGIE